MSSTKQKLPEGWSWALVSQVTEKVPNVRPQDSPKQAFGYIDISSIDNSKFRIVNQKTFLGKDAPSRAKRSIQTGDVLFSNVRTYLRNVAIVSEEWDARLASTGFAVLRSNGVVKPRFLFHYVLSDEFINAVTARQTGTHYPATSDRVVKAQSMRLPPLAEQERIVAVVENLFTRISNTKERLETAAKTMKRFRKSVLNAACTGKLTEDWREGKNTKDWAETSVKDVATKIQYGYTASSKKNIEGPRFLRITDIQKGKVNWDDVPFCKIDKRHIMKYQLETGDIVFARTGATTGKSFLIKECPLSIFASYLIRIKPDKKKILPEYLYIFFQSDSYWEQIAGKLSGSAQPNCNATKLSNLELFLPSLLEQAEIADLVEMLFELAGKVEVRIKEARERVVRLTHSILAKAFKGELVPTEAELARRQGRTYETAVQLLERIKLEREKKRTLEIKVSEKIKIREKKMSAVRGPKKRPILEVLTEAHDKLKPEQLFEKAGFTEEFVDDFYEELREAVQAEQIKELRPNKTEIYLEAIKP